MSEKPKWASGVDGTIAEPFQSTLKSVLDIANAVTALQDRLGMERLHNWQLRCKIDQYERMTGIRSGEMPHDSASTEELQKLLKARNS